jgi:uncharacterized protein (UPF0548 family)
MRAIRLRRPGRDALDATLAIARRSELTHPDPGRTLDDPPEARSWSLALPTRPDPFDAAVGALQSFVPHRLGTSSVVHPEQPALEVGTTFVVATRVGPLHVVAPLRIVAALDEVDRFGFAYGTLTGHPLRGEEAFVLRRRGDRRVVLDVVSLSAPAGIFRLGGPLVGAAQAVIARRYLRAVATSVIAGSR